MKQILSQRFKIKDGKFVSFAGKKSYDDLPETKKMIEEFLQIGSKRKQEYSATTIKTHRSQLNLFFAQVHKEYDKITSEDMRFFWVNYLRHCKENKLSEQYPNIMVNAVKSFFSYLERIGLIEKAPTNMLITRSQSPQDLMENIKNKIMTREEITKMLSIITSPRDRAMFTLWFYHGMRISEIEKLRVTDIDFKNNTITIRKSKNGKTRENKMLPTTASRLANWLDIRKGLTLKAGHVDYVFSSKYGKHLEKNMLREIWYRYLGRTGIVSGTRTLTPHSARHSFITNALEDGVPIEEVADFVGHDSITTTKKYADMLHMRKNSYGRLFKGY